MRPTSPALVVLTLIASATAHAQMATNDDRLISYAGYLQDGVGPVTDVVTLRIALFTSNSTASGANDCLRDDFSNCGLWGEELSGVKVSAGRFSVVLGETVSLIDTDLASNQLWVAIGVMGTSDAGFAPLNGRQQLIPVPFASRAAQAKDYKVTGTTFLQGTTNLSGPTNLSGTTSVQGPLRVSYEDDVDIANFDGSVIIGNGTTNLAFDNNEIMARNSVDTLNLQAQGGLVRIGSDAFVDDSLELSCTACGGTGANGTGSGNYSRMVIQGRVMSTSTNMHLSPPGGAAVIINDDFRGAGGGTAGEARLEVEGPIRLTGNGDLRLRVDGTSRASTGNIDPEVYRLDSTTCARGDLWVGRPSAQSDQDSLCVCLNIAGTLEAWCFNP